MTRVLLHAPRADRSVVAAPSLDSWPGVVQNNRALLAGHDFDLQGRSWQSLRRLARAELLRRARLYTDTLLDAAGVREDGNQASIDDVPLIATGHQPELFHPGVWIKNFAVAVLARHCGGASLNLVVDNDRVKNLAVRVPHGPLSAPGIVLVPLDRWQGELPYEEHFVKDEDTFQAFAERVYAAVSSLGIDPLVTELWRYALRAARWSRRLSDRIVAARRSLEGALGVHNLELTVSELCTSESFYWFLCHIAAHAERFCTVHNEILARFREEQGIHDPLRPVPDLANRGGWWELPFWVWRPESPYRRALHVLIDGANTWFGDGVDWQLKLPLAPDRDACCAVERLKELAEQGRIKLRTRALTTTLFMRLFVSDLFVHGLGGAIYDQVTDDLIRGFYGLPAPDFVTLSATVYLPVPRPQVDRQELVRLQQELRALLYNPQRFLSEQQLADPRVRSLVERKLELIRYRPETRRERRERFREFRRINAELAQLFSDRVAVLQVQIQELERKLKIKRILENREYPFAVYPATYLARFYEESLAGLWTGSPTGTPCR